MRQRTIAALLTVVCGLLRVAAQELELGYTGELQVETKGKPRFLTLLRADFSQPLPKGWRIDASTISIASTGGSHEPRDLQGFSNIDAPTIPLVPAVLGVGWKSGNSDVFAGIRNLNEDYFVSPCTSLFTGSSSGIFPTLASNWELANYPLSALGIDWKVGLGRWSAEVSLYNGIAYSNLAGRENVFRFCPGSDGLFAALGAAYEKDATACYLGVGVHTGSSRRERPDDQSSGVTMWGYAEQKVAPAVSIMLQASASPSPSSVCRGYAGAGIVADVGKTTGGLMAGYAAFADDHEWNCELTWKIPIIKGITLQPAVHFFTNTQNTGVAGILRVER